MDFFLPGTEVLKVLKLQCPAHLFGLPWAPIGEKNVSAGGVHPGQKEILPEAHPHFNLYFLNPAFYFN